MTKISTKHKPVLLCILDGWGERADSQDNAIVLAKTPHFRALRQRWPMTTIEASETHVGLPVGQMGNSEVGHTCIGAGRVVRQDLPRIDYAISSGELARHPDLAEAVKSLNQSGGSLHVMGLVSPGGVHSHQSHIAFLANYFTQQGIRVWLHLWTDGRDTPPRSADKFIESLVDKAPQAKIASIGGRFYAMDRDQRWERLELAFQAMVEGNRGPSPQFQQWSELISSSWQAGVNDEFIKPACQRDYQGMQDGDGVLIVNFRADRARQISAALFDKDFTAFIRPVLPAHFATKLIMSEYAASLKTKAKVLFPPFVPSDTLGEVIAQQGLRQLRIAETEKYAHVTFFFNGGREDLFEGEERILIPSPKVKTYDLQPSMAASEITKALLTSIHSGKYGLIIANFANADMVGHCGILGAAMEAVEAVDQALGELAQAILAEQGLMMICADHGNAEIMVDPDTHEPHTAHTLEVTPFILIGEDHYQLRAGGTLADIAPTILALMKIKQPEAMTGKSLLIAA